MYYLFNFKHLNCLFFLYAYFICLFKNIFLCIFYILPCGKYTIKYVSCEMMLSIFSDFDDTISIGDIGNKLFIHFGEFDKYISEFALGRITVRELNILLCASIPTKTTIEEIEDFALEQDIDPYFLPFVNFCQNNNYKLHIVSDGYGIYINQILKKYNLDFLPKYHNELIKTTSGFVPVFYGASESCNCSTASCKRNVILNNSTEEDIMVYIGDGTTDFCAAEHCDIIFAKSDLANYCRKNKIPYHHFKTFFDVQRILQSLLQTKKIKQRNQSFLKRKSAFEAE